MDFTKPGHSAAAYSVWVCVLSPFCHVQIFATRRTVACQAPLSMGLSRQEYWSGLLCPLTRDRSWVSCIAGRFFATESPGKPSFTVLQLHKAWDFVVITASCFLRVYTNFDSFRSPYGSGFWSTAYVCSTWTQINIESSCQLEILRDHGL